MGAKDGDPDTDPETPGSTPGETVAPESESDEGTAVADPPEGSGGLPGWVAPGLIGLLFAAAGIALVLRGRRSGT